MIAWLIQYLIAGACILFVVSLPLQQTMLAKTLRRFAGAALLLAFALNAYHWPPVAAFVVGLGLALPSDPQFVISGIAVGLAFAACLNAPIPDRPRFGVFRM